MISFVSVFLVESRIENSVFVHDATDFGMLIGFH